MEKEIRLNKYLAQCGIASRRSAEKLMQAGMVKVNGVIIKEMGIKVDPSKDKIVVGEMQVQPRENLVYYLLNKPKGYVTTSLDPLRRKKAIDLVPNKPRVFSVGRLDKDTTGLLILTNDGDFAYHLSHPKFNKEKEYIVKTQTEKINIPIEDFIATFLKGIDLEEGIASADRVEIIKQGWNLIEFKIIIHQGWKRQIRRMCDAIGLRVSDLRRIRVGSLELGGLEEGKWRELTEDEVEELMK